MHGCRGTDALTPWIRARTPGHACTYAAAPMRDYSLRLRRRQASLPVYNGVNARVPHTGTGLQLTPRVCGCRQTKKKAT